MRLDELVEKIQGGDSTALARGITLLESKKTSDWELSKKLLTSLKESENKTHRLGFSGPPGAGKSTFIEKLGLALVHAGHKVAVLAIDPSSEISGGSILGDKTRMENLSRSPQAFVRPSPTRGHLGGGTGRLPGVIELCEAAGYSWILIESVGVGQSEVELSQMVDFFTLISQPGAGDELQGIKKGILEYVDLIMVNKMDRDPGLVNSTRQQFLGSLKIMRGREVEVLACSALTGDGVDGALKQYQSFFSKYDYKRRLQFSEKWFQSLVYSEFRSRIKSQHDLRVSFEKFNDQVRSKSLSPIEAVDSFFTEIGLKGS